MVKLNNNEINDVLDAEIGKQSNKEFRKINEEPSVVYLGIDGWKESDLKGAFEIKENFEDFKKTLQESIANGVIDKIIKDRIGLQQWTWVKEHDDGCMEYGLNQRDSDGDEIYRDIIRIKKDDEGISINHDDDMLQYDDEYAEDLSIKIKDNRVEIYLEEWTKHHGGHDDFLVIEPTSSGNTVVKGNPYNFVRCVGDDRYKRPNVGFLNDVVSVGVRGLMTYDGDSFATGKMHKLLSDGEKHKAGNLKEYAERQDWLKQVEKEEDKRYKTAKKNDEKKFEDISTQLKKIGVICMNKREYEMASDDYREKIDGLEKVKLRGEVCSARYYISSNFIQQNKHKIGILKESDCITFSADKLMKFAKLKQLKSRKNVYCASKRVRTSLGLGQSRELTPEIKIDIEKSTPNKNVPNDIKVDRSRRNEVEK